MNKSLFFFKRTTIIVTFGMLDLLFGQTKFAIIGDFGDDNADELAVSNLVKSWNPDYIITTGDNSYDATDIDINIGKYYQEFIYPYAGNFGSGSPTISNRFWVTLGNHDYSDGGGITAHFNYFVLPNNERYYDLIKDNVHLFMVNSNPEETDGTSSTSAQADWMRTKMLDCVVNHLHWRIVAFHHPPYSSGEHQSSIYMRWPFQSWGAHFVVSGHDHNYERIEIDGFPYFVNGTGGRSLRNFGEILPQSAVRDSTHFGAQLVTVSNDTCYIDFYGTDGVRYDRRIITDPALPVELINFSARILNNRIILEWKTETEVNNYGFEILRSIYHQEYNSQHNNWKVIGFVKGHGNSNSSKEYSYVDASFYNFNQTVYYRLKQIDNDGKFEYSKIIEVDLELLKEFDLSQNYPNPFNPSTKLSYTINNSSFVSLKVYDIMGNEVSTLVYEEKPKGYYEVVFDASGLASGMYFYRLIAGSFVEIKKMTLLK